MKNIEIAIGNNKRKPIKASRHIVGLFIKNKQIFERNCNALKRMIQFVLKSHSLLNGREIEIF